MKKLWIVLLVIIMSLSFSLVALAEENTPPGDDYVSEENDSQQLEVQNIGGLGTDPWAIADISWYTNDTSAIEFEISDAYDLAGLAKLVNGTAIDDNNDLIAAVDFSGKTIKLTDDIDLQNGTWTPIGDGSAGSTIFAGIFDGQDYTVSNLFIDQPESIYLGLFGRLGVSTITNLNISDVSINGYGWVGALAGMGPTSQAITIDDVDVDNVILNSGRMVGGVIGQIYSSNIASIRNCDVRNANITCTPHDADYNGDKAGGVIGHAGHIIIDACTVDGLVLKAYRDAGAITAYHEKDSQVTNNFVANAHLRLNKNLPLDVDESATDSKVNLGVIIGRLMNNNYVLGSGNGFDYESVSLQICEKNEATYRELQKLLTGSTPASFLAAYVTGIDGIKGEYSTVKAAVDASVSGDCIHVVAGTFAEETITINDKDIDIVGPEYEGDRPIAILDGGNTNGIIDANGHQLFIISGTSKVELRNLALQNASSSTIGGAINLSAELTLENCWFEGNINNSYRGSAINVEGTGTLVARDTTFIDNIYFGTTAYGGAVSFANSNNNNQLIECDFIGNEATQAYVGAVAVNASSVTVTDCLFKENSGHSSSAIYADNMADSTINISGCIFDSNIGVNGTTYTAAGTPEYTISDCVFVNNTTSKRGAGIYASGPARVVDCIFAGNTDHPNVINDPTEKAGAAVYGAIPQVSGCVFIDNHTIYEDGEGADVISDMHYNCFLYPSIDADVTGNYWDGNNLPNATCFTKDLASSYVYSSTNVTYEEGVVKIDGIPASVGSQNFLLSAKVNAPITLRSPDADDMGFLQIQQAFDAATDGDTIIIPAGTYQETLYLDKSIEGLTILGANYGHDPNGGNWNEEETILNGTEPGKGGILRAGAIRIDDAASDLAITNLTIQGITFQGQGITASFGNADINYDLSGLTIKDNLFENIDSLVAPINIQNALSRGSGTFSLSGSVICHNRFENVASTDGNYLSGIYLTGLSDLSAALTVNNNYFRDIQYSGIHLAGATSGQIVVCGNTLENWNNSDAGGRAFRLNNLDLEALGINNNILLPSTDIRTETQYLKLDGTYPDLFNASLNYWGGSDPDFATIINSVGPIVLYPYYYDEARSLIVQEGSNEPVSSRTNVREIVGNISDDIKNIPTEDMTPEQQQTVNDAVQQIIGLENTDIAASPSNLQTIYDLEELYIAANANIEATTVDDSVVLPDGVDAATIAITGAALSVPSSAAEPLHSHVTVAAVDPPASDILPDNVPANASLIAFDIDLKILNTAGKNVITDLQPLAPITISMAVPVSVDAANLIIVHELHSGGVEVIRPTVTADATCASGYRMSFTVSQLSRFTATNTTPRTKAYIPDSDKYSVTVTSNTGGSVDPSGSFQVKEDKDVSFKLTINDGYELDYVLVNDKKISVSGDGFSIKGISENTTVKVYFKKVETPIVNQWANPFTDVKSTDWFFDNVRYVCEQNLMTGKTATLFAPQNAITRAEIVTILWRMEGKPVLDADNAFTDVVDTAYYYPALIWAFSKDIVGGVGNSLYEPSKTLTREQMAAVMYRYAQYKNYDISASQDLISFADKQQISQWAEDAMKWAVGKNILTGKNGSSLDPQGKASRAEIATIIQRFIENDN